LFCGTRSISYASRIGRETLAALIAQAKKTVVSVDKLPEKYKWPIHIQIAKQGKNMGKYLLCPKQTINHFLSGSLLIVNFSVGRRGRRCRGRRRRRRGKRIRRWWPIPIVIRW